MNEEKKYMDKVKHDRSLSERIAMRIPGFRGYKEKELRKDTDQLIRNQVCTFFRTSVNDLKWCYREMINAGFIDDSRDLNRVIMKTDTINQKISHAKRGYSGMWQAAKVTDDELTEVLRYDALLIEIADEINNKVSNIKQMIENNNFEEGLKLIKNFEKSIDDLEVKFNERDQVIIGLSKVGD